MSSLCWIKVGKFLLYLSNISLSSTIKIQHSYVVRLEQTHIPCCITHIISHAQNLTYSDQSPPPCTFLDLSRAIFEFLPSDLHSKHISKVFRRILVKVKQLFHNFAFSPMSNMDPLPYRYRVPPPFQVQHRQ
jgi:hypothetical protein